MQYNRYNCIGEKYNDIKCKVYAIPFAFEYGQDAPKICFKWHNSTVEKTQMLEYATKW